ncbi:MAG: prepilin-type N-terminal cleavage/methylation domain-containing protein [Pirellulales bacterium]
MRNAECVSAPASACAPRPNRLRCNSQYAISNTQYRGVSLLEVLISIFVLAVGLLSVAALMPLANYEVEQGQRMEKVVVVGDWAISTMEAAGAFDPSRWVMPDGTPFDAVDRVSGRRLILRAAGSSTAGSIAVDTSAGSTGLSGTAGFYNNCVLEFRSGALRGVKRFVDTYNSGTFQLSGNFPVSPTAGDTFTITRRQAFAIDPLFIAQHDDDNDASNFPYNNAVMPRVTLTSGAGGTTPMDLAMADSLCTSTDSLAFELPQDTSLMPEQLMIDSDGDGDRDDKRMFKGEYSYLLTVAPYTADDGGTVSVSVVVFESRRLAETADAGVLGINFVGGGYSGGEAELAQATNAVRPGQWILVASTSGPATYRWYRVAAAQPVAADGKTYLSLVGADWNSAQAGTAVVFDGVVGVYERPVRLRNLPIGRPTP